MPKLPRSLVLLLVLLLCVIGLASAVPAIRAEAPPYRIAFPLIGNNLAFALLDSPPPHYPLGVEGATLVTIPGGDDTTPIQFTLTNPNDIAVNPRCYLIYHKAGGGNWDPLHGRIISGPFYLTTDGMVASPRVRLQPQEERVYTSIGYNVSWLESVSCIGVAAEEPTPAPTVPPPAVAP